MKYSKWTVVTVCAMMSILLAMAPASAQTTFTPATPLFSPWHGLFNRPDNRNVDNFNQFVRPQFEQQQQRAAQQQAIDALQRQNRAFQQQLDFGTMPQGGVGAQGAGTAMPPGISQIRRTGTVSRAATFRNYSHFYPSAPR